jgi:hypothetical protein
MQRSKQQALMFLLGAVLVGGALGFSADRYIGHQKFTAQYGPRSRFFDDIGLSVPQRATLDSLLFARECEMKALLAPTDSAQRVIRHRFGARLDSILTKEQKTLLEKMRQEAQERHKAEQAKEPKRPCSVN